MSLRGPLLTLLLAKLSAPAECEGEGVGQESGVEAHTHTRNYQSKQLIPNTPYQGKAANTQPSIKQHLETLLSATNHEEIKPHDSAI